VTLRVSAVCGLLAPVAFTIGWVLGALAQPHGFSVAHEDVSDLGALTASHAWLYNQVGGNLTGLLVLALALGLWRALPDDLSAHVGVAALAVSGIGQFLDGLLRLDCRAIDGRCDDRITSWHAVGHAAETVVTTISLLVAMFVLARAFARADGWRDLGRASLVAGIATLVALGGLYFVGSGLAVLVASSVFFVWVAIVAVRLLAVARALERG
jgi:hypothetical protein